MKKKVLFMIDSLTCGGAEKSLVSLLPLLDYNKIDVTLMLVARGGVFEPYVPKEVRIINYTSGCKSLFERIRFRLNYNFFSIALRLNKFKKHPFNAPTLEWMICSSVIKPLKEEFDVAVAYQQGFPCWYIMDKVTAKKKYAWINVDITKTKFRINYIKPYYAKYDGVVAVSDGLYKILLKIGLIDKHRVHCIYDILNADLIKKQAKESFGGRAPVKDITSIVTVARLISSNKGQDLCLEAAKILKNKGLKFQWFFVGDGPSRNSLEQSVKKMDLNSEISFVGMQPNPYPYMNAADIYVQSSRFEGFGLTVTEAKILGRAIVTTNFPTAYNQIVDGKNGLIVEMTAESIANGIEMLMLDASLCDRLRNNSEKEINTTALTESKKVMDLIFQ